MGQSVGVFNVSRLRMSSLISPYGGDVCPEQWGQRAAVLVGERGRQGVVGEDVLDHEGVDVDQRCLQRIHTESTPQEMNRTQRLEDHGGHR